MIRGQRKARPYPPSVQASPATGKASQEADALARAAAFSSLRDTTQRPSAKHAWSYLSPPPQQALEIHLFKRLKAREPRRSDSPSTWASSHPSGKGPRTPRSDPLRPAQSLLPSASMPLPRVAPPLFLPQQKRAPEPREPLSQMLDPSKISSRPRPFPARQQGSARSAGCREAGPAPQRRSCPAGRRARSPWRSRR